MILSAHQPAPFPSVQYFAKIYFSDIFLLRDDVPISKGDWQHKFSIRDSANGKQIVSVPLIKKTRALPLRDIKISNWNTFQNETIKTINRLYKKTDFFDLIYPETERILNQGSGYLIDLCLPTIHLVLDLFSWEKIIIHASEQSLTKGKNEALIDACLKAEADCYLTGKGGWNYIEEAEYNLKNISVKTLLWKSRKYPQKGSENFNENLSILDTLFMLGPSAADFIFDPEETVIHDGKAC